APDSRVVNHRDALDTAPIGKDWFSVTDFGAPPRHPLGIESSEETIRAANRYLRLWNPCQYHVRREFVSIVVPLRNDIHVLIPRALVIRSELHELRATQCVREIPIGPSPVGAVIFGP